MGIHNTIKDNEQEKLETFRDPGQFTIRHEDSLTRVQSVVIKDVAAAALLSADLAEFIANEIKRGRAGTT